MKVIFLFFGALVFGAPVIFRRKCNNIISALSFRRSDPAPPFEAWPHSQTKVVFIHTNTERRQILRHALALLIQTLLP